MRRLNLGFYDISHPTVHHSGQNAVWILKIAAFNALNGAFYNHPSSITGTQLSLLVNLTPELSSSARNTSCGICS